MATSAAPALDLAKFNSCHVEDQGLRGGRKPHESSKSKWQSSYGCPLAHTSLRAYLSPEKQTELLASLPKEELQDQYYNEAIKFSYIQGLFDSADLTLHINQTRKCRALKDNVKEVFAGTRCQLDTPRTKRKMVLGSTITGTRADHDILSHPNLGEPPPRPYQDRQRREVSGKITSSQVPYEFEWAGIGESVSDSHEPSKCSYQSKSSAGRSYMTKRGGLCPPGHTGPIKAPVAPSSLHEPLQSSRPRWGGQEDSSIISSDTPLTAAAYAEMGYGDLAGDGQCNLRWPVNQSPPKPDTNRTQMERDLRYRGKGKAAYMPLAARIPALAALLKKS